MKQIIRMIGLLALLLTMAISSASVMAQGGDGQVRFVHAIPGASAIDVYTDGQLTASDLTFGDATTYATIPAGDHQLVVTVAGAGTASPIWQQTLSVPNATPLTLVAASASESSFLVYQDDLNPIGLGKARLSAIHAISGGPTVDLVLTDGRPVIPALEYGVQQLPGTLDVPAFAYDFAVVPSGSGVDQAIVTANTVALGSNTSYMLVVYGTAESPAVLALTAPTQPETAGGFVRVIHGVSDAPDVDVYVNDTLIFPSLGVAGFTPHTSVAAGSYDVTIKPAGSPDTLTTATLTVESGATVTVAALGTVDELSLNVFEDNVAGVEAGQARVALINGLPDTINAALADGTALASDLAFGTEGEAVSFAPSKQAISLLVGENSADIPDENFYGGVYYNLLVMEYRNLPYIVVAPTSLAQGIASAPAAGSTAVVEVPTADAAAVAVVATPTLPPPPAATVPGITGRVFNLDADRNLQLRQYPNSTALSLATVPPNTVLVVNGREGEIIPLPNSATPTPPADYTYTDPASLLAEDEDLDPNATWLSVTYTTPDGGSITAWANALYVDVRNDRGERVLLATLPTVPANQPGDVDNTAVTPPPVPQDRVAAIVFNLDPGINLNIRRTPDVNGEVLARLPNGTVMEFVGIKEDQQWVFVRYSPAEGGSVTGWVSATYVQYTYNSRLIDLEEIETRDLLAIIADDTRGETGAGAASVVVPTVDPVKDRYVAVVSLDAGSNLNLRRNPTQNSEVLAQIPSGTQLLVNTRTADELWLNVTFEGVDGWIAAKTDLAQFVRLTFNGKPAEIAQVPIAVEGNIAAGTPSVIVTPTAGPTAEGSLPFNPQPYKVTDVAIQMTGSPGGNADGLPIIFQGQEVTQLFTDGTFSFIELPDTTQGWVPAGSIQPR
ncbi:MAG: DUF4397 domain-containing protein [Anaerolineae bacterium]|nr:DUF4397 domain-containing protein [Anaerolineae bacterium]